MARELSIVYGSVTMAEAPYTLNGVYVETQSAESLTIEWEVVCTGTSEADFQSQCDTLEAEFRKRFLNLTVTFGAQTHRSMSHSTNTGFNGEPSISKLEDSASNRSRVYRCGVSFQLPASDNNGRRSSEVSVIEDESRIRTLRVVAVYTAQGGTAARANAEAKLPNYVSSIRSALGGTWDKEVLAITSDDQDKTATAVWEQQEIVYKESSAGLDHAAIIRPEIIYESTSSFPGDSPGGDARRRRQIVASYQCGVDKDQTTDLATLYKDTIRPYLISEAERIYGADTLAPTSESPRLDYRGNRIGVRMVFDAVVDGGTVYSYAASQKVDTGGGKILVPVWDGNQWAKEVYQGPSTAVRTTVVSKVSDGAQDLAPVAGLGEVSGAAGSTRPSVPEDAGGGWIFIGESNTRDPVEIGDGELGDTIKATLEQWAIIEAYAEEPERSGGPTETDNEGNGGGGGGTTGEGVGSPVTETFEDGRDFPQGEGHGIDLGDSPAFDNIDGSDFERRG